MAIRRATQPNCRCSRGLKILRDDAAIVLGMGKSAREIARLKSRWRLPPVLLALAEYRPNGRNCRDQSDCGQSSPNRFSLFCAEPVSQKQGDACSDHSPCHDDEREFWSGKLDLLHISKMSSFPRDKQGEGCRPCSPVRSPL
jgi:hypothetical protein